jgi:hypothetical protein
MTRKTITCGQIAAGFAVVFASAISPTQAQGIEVGHGSEEGCPVVYTYRQHAVERAHVRHARHVRRCSDQPMCDRQWLWYDP